jgi:hypothetical protein
MAVLVLVSFDGPDEVAEGAHELTLQLLDDDGSPVSVPGTEAPITLTVSLKLGHRPDGTPAEAPTIAPFVVNIGPGLPLEPGRRYRWEAEVDGKHEHRGDASFVTREVPAPTG